MATTKTFGHSKHCAYILVSFIKLILCSIVICVSDFNKSSLVQAIHWDHSVDLNNDYRILWNIFGQEITFEVQVRTLGYVGLGFSNDGRLPGSDVVIGWVSQGQVHFQVSAIFLCLLIFIWRTILFELGSNIFLFIVFISLNSQLTVECRFIQVRTNIPIF